MICFKIALISKSIWLREWLCNELSQQLRAKGDPDSQVSCMIFKEKSSLGRNEFAKGSEKSPFRV